jgi:hypothetical protein
MELQLDLILPKATTWLGGYYTRNLPIHGFLETHIALAYPKNDMLLQEP